jgi:hypothetical protein
MGAVQMAKVGVCYCNCNRKILADPAMTPIFYEQIFTWRDSSLIDEKFTSRPSRVNQGLNRALLLSQRERPLLLVLLSQRLDVHPCRQELNVKLSA